MKVLANISREENDLQGLLKQSFSSYGLSGKGASRTYEIGELINAARVSGCDAIFVTNPNTLKNIVNDPRPSLEDWRGSVLKTSIPIVISNPLAHINTKPEGKKLHTIDVAKLKQLHRPAFKYDLHICTGWQDIQVAENAIIDADIVVIDIETNYHNQITSVAFTPIHSDWNIKTTYVISLMPVHYNNKKDDIFQAWNTIKFLCESDQPKVLHNGAFDCFHLLRYNICVENYLWDTEYLWRCWHAELPKALAKVCSYILPDYYYWKHESETSPLEYNGKDTINTARIFLYILQYAPRWVWTNYTQLLPNLGPVLYTAFEGFLVDQDRRVEARAHAQADLDRELAELRLGLGLPDFNPGSPAQVSTLLYKVLRAKKPARAKSESATGNIELKKVAMQHPLFSWIVDRILAYRDKKKAISTYYDAALTDNDRLLYSLNLDGTETARMACNSSSLYALKPGKLTHVKTNMRNLGQQLQNIPKYYKKALMADPGYKLINKDKAQSEARCVGYLSPCQALIDALENPPELENGVRDFYCYTGYEFFGVVFDRDHVLRQAVKKIIHGTNYLMGIQTFIDSVGVQNLQEYKRILGYNGTLYSFAKHLLGLYHALYPEVKDGWERVQLEVIRTGRIVTPDGWVRLVEGDIQKHHSILRGIVAHKSQHWSVWGINKAFWKLFYNLQVPSGGEFRLKGQIHDSIVAQVKEEKFEYYSQRMEEIMDIPQVCEHGTMRIPLDTESGYYWREKKE